MTRIFTLGLAIVALSGCAHSFMRGTVAMKLDNKKAHVCLGNKDVKVGDKVAFFRNLCTTRADREYADLHCEIKKIGTGSVTKLLNAHYSEVQTDGSFKFSEGTLVEKM